MSGRYEYCISGGPGILLERGKVDVRAKATERLDEHVFTKSGVERGIARGMGRYEDDGEITHLFKGKLTLTTMPEGYEG